MHVLHHSTNMHMISTNIAQARGVGMQSKAKKSKAVLSKAVLSDVLICWS